MWVENVTTSRPEIEEKGLKVEIVEKKAENFEVESNEYPKKAEEVQEQVKPEDDKDDEREEIFVKSFFFENIEEKKRGEIK